MSAKEDSTTEWFASEARLEESRDALARSLYRIDRGGIDAESGS